MVSLPPPMTLIRLVPLFTVVTWPVLSRRATLGFVGRRQGSEAVWVWCRRFVVWFAGVPAAHE
jgi:hypothetical protein